MTKKGIFWQIRNKSIPYSVMDDTMLKKVAEYIETLSGKNKTNMTIQEYQKNAKRTLAELGSMKQNIDHMILGFISEVGELADAYKKHIAYGKELDKVNVLEELADITWYVANYASLVGQTLDDVILDYSSYTSPPRDVIAHLSLEVNNNPLSMYVVILQVVKHLGFTKEEYNNALNNNINKLKIRYPDKFSQEKALNRDLTKERTELEK